MYIKEHNLDSGLMVAVCAAELIGKRFVDGDLNLKITEGFYKISATK
jgi:hypothetical protein